MHRWKSGRSGCELERGSGFRRISLDRKIAGNDRPKTVRSTPRVYESPPLDRVRDFHMTSRKRHWVWYGANGASSLGTIDGTFQVLVDRRRRDGDL